MILFTHILSPYGVSDLRGQIQFLSLSQVPLCLAFFIVTFQMFQKVIFWFLFGMAICAIMAPDWFVSNMA